MCLQRVTLLYVKLLEVSKGYLLPAVAVALVRNVALALKKKGYSVSHQSVAAILSEMKYSLQANSKTKEGKAHPDRNKQFLYINRIAKKFLAQRNPVISVDTKKKDLVGNYKNAGRARRPRGNPVKVNGHDFPDKKVPKAVPYGIYDIGDNKGWINVGVTADTAEFAVESIRQWWRKMGKKRYLTAKKLLIFADSGGSNASRSRLWKRELQRFVDAEKLNITVCHFPPGTSKWNKIEHRLFSFVTMNCRGKPLLTYQTIINLISSTMTTTGLTVKARMDKRTYKKGIKILPEEFRALQVQKHAFRGEWNYTFKPKNGKITAPKWQCYFLTGP